MYSYNWPQALTSILCSRGPPYRAHLQSSPDMVGKGAGPCWLGVGVTRKEIYKPKMTAQAPTQREVLEAIYCGCMTGCTRGTCKCRKLGLPCTMVCLDCKCDCYNIETVATSDDWIYDRHYVKCLHYTDLHRARDRSVVVVCRVRYHHESSILKEVLFHISN